MQTVKWLQVSLVNTNNSISGTQLKIFRYNYLTQIILVNIIHSFALSFKYCYVSLTIQLHISHLFTLLNV